MLTREKADKLSEYYDDVYTKLEDKLAMLEDTGQVEWRPGLLTRLSDLFSEIEFAIQDSVQPSRKHSSKKATRR